MRWIIAPLASISTELKGTCGRDKTARVTLWSRTQLGGSLTVFIVPRENGKSMELTCQIQCTYRLTEVTVRKDLAQQSTQKTLEGPWGHFPLNGDMEHQYCISTAALNFQLGGIKEKKDGI